ARVVGGLRFVGGRGGGQLRGHVPHLYNVGPGCREVFSHTEEDPVLCAVVKLGDGRARAVGRSSCWWVDFDIGAHDGSGIYSAGRSKADGVKCLRGCLAGVSAASVQSGSGTRRPVVEVIVIEGPIKQDLVRISTSWTHGYHRGRS